MAARNSQPAGGQPLAENRLNGPVIISELIRNGPAWSLTWAITPSVVTSVTSPRK